MKRGDNREEEGNPFQPYRFNFCFSLFQPSYSDSRVILIPVSFRGSDTDWDTRNGPERIISASKELELYDFEISFQAADYGIFTMDEMWPDNITIETLLLRLEDVVSRVLSEGKFPLLLGSNHLTTPAMVKGVSRHRKDFGILYISGRGDLNEGREGEMALRPSLGRFLHENFCTTFWGVRSLSTSEYNYMQGAGDGLKLFTAEEIWEGGFNREVFFDSLPSYLCLSLDMDVFDPSVVSAHNNIEPGGLLFHHVTSLLREVFSQREVIAAEVVEFTPDPIRFQSAVLAAKLVYRIAGLKLLSVEKRDDSL